MRTAELTGALLDYWVARAEWLKISHMETERCMVRVPAGAIRPFQPSTNWAQGGPIIERHGIKLEFEDWRTEAWCAKVHSTKKSQRGPTPLVAAMRAYVDSKFGDEVPDEVELPA